MYHTAKSYRIDISNDAGRIFYTNMSMLEKVIKAYILPSFSIQ